MDELLESFGSQALFRLSATEDDFGGATPVRTRYIRQGASRSTSLCTQLRVMRA